MAQNDTNLPSETIKILHDVPMACIQIARERIKASRLRVLTAVGKQVLLTYYLVCILWAFPGNLLRLFNI